VAAGDLLFEQDTRRAETQVAQAEAAMRQTRARLDELIRGPRREQILATQAGVRGAEKERQFLEGELQRAQEIYDRKLSSAEARDRALAARDIAEATLQSQKARLDELLSGTTGEEIRQAEQSLRQAEARLASVQIDLDRHSVRAPVNAVVDTLLFEVGERPAPGQPLAILLTGAQPHARVYVPEALRLRVRAGMSVRVLVDGLDEPLAGRVRWVSADAAFTPYFALTEDDRGRLSYAAKVDILDAPERLPDGVPVVVEIALPDDAPQ
jgi:HlyD family secretion protein